MRFLASIWGEGPIGQAAAVVTLAAAIALVAVIVHALSLRVNVDAFLSVLRKLLAADNTDRAFKLCAAAPTAPVVQLAKVGLHAWVAIQADGGDADRVSEARAVAAREAMKLNADEVLRAPLRGFAPAQLFGIVAVAMNIYLATHLHDMWLRQGIVFFLTLPVALLTVWTLLIAARFRRDIRQTLSGIHTIHV